MNGHLNPKFKLKLLFTKLVGLKVSKDLGEVKLWHFV